MVLILSRTTVWTKDSTWRECRISWRTYPEGRKHCCEMKWETENRICKKINLKCLETKSSYLLLAATVRKYGFSYLSVIVLFFCLNLKAYLLYLMKLNWYLYFIMRNAISNPCLKLGVEYCDYRKSNSALFQDHWQSIIF